MGGGGDRERKATRRKIVGKEKMQEEGGEMNEERMEIRKEETCGQGGVDGEGQIRMYDKGSWG